MAVSKNQDERYLQSITEHVPVRNESQQMQVEV